MHRSHPLIAMTSLLLCAATACAPIGRGVQKIGTAVHEETIAMDHRVRDWFDSENIYGEERNLPDPTVAYCYKTLGEAECYAQPIIGQDRRLIGKQLPQPMFIADAYPVPDLKPAPPVLYIDAEVTDPGPVATVAPPTTVVVSDLPQTAPPVPAVPVRPMVVTPEAGQPQPLIPVFEE